MIEPIALPVDIVEEIERRAKAAGITPEAMARRLVAEELPYLVADLLGSDLPGQRGSEPQLALPASTNDSAPAVHRGTVNDFDTVRSSIGIDAPGRLAAASTAQSDADARS